MTNIYLQQGVENATTTARHGADDAKKFMTTTSLQVNHLLVTNYDELSTHLGDMLSGTYNSLWIGNTGGVIWFYISLETTDVVINKLEIQANAHSLTQVANFADSLGQIQIDLSRMNEITTGLRVNASQLSDGNYW